MPNITNLLGWIESYEGEHFFERVEIVPLAHGYDASLMSPSAGSNLADISWGCSFVTASSMAGQASTICEY